MSWENLTSSPVGHSTAQRSRWCYAVAAPSEWCPGNPTTRTTSASLGEGLLSGLVLAPGLIRATGPSGCASFRSPTSHPRWLFDPRNSFRGYRESSELQMKIRWSRLSTVNSWGTHIPNLYSKPSWWRWYSTVEWKHPSCSANSRVVCRLFAFTELSSAAKSTSTWRPRPGSSSRDISSLLNFSNQFWHCRSLGASSPNTVLILRWASAAVWLSWNSYSKQWRICTFSKDIIFQSAQPVKIFFAKLNMFEKVG